jgi:GT2 family glycosyltransferase
MKFSVLICTYNRHELLERCLDSLVSGTQEKPDEIVVVNGGDSRTDDVIQKFIDPGRQHDIEIKLINTVNKNLAASRNVGLPHCTGDIVAMTDDDAQVFPDWVTQMKRVHETSPDAGAVGGLVFGTNVGSLVGKVADAITFPSWEGAREVRTLPGVNISYKRVALDAIGLQDETLFRGEDVDFNWRLIKAGYTIYFDPAIKVYHHHRPTVRGFLNQHFMYGRAYYLVRRKWPDMYCVYPHGFRRFRDLLKAGNFMAGLIYDPVLSAMKVPGIQDRLASLPLLGIAEAAWKSGMVVQAVRECFSRTPPQPVPETETVGAAQ